jgi:hypothetical protein
MGEREREKSRWGWSRGMPEGGSPNGPHQPLRKPPPRRPFWAGHWGFSLSLFHSQALGVKPITPEYAACSLDQEPTFRRASLDKENVSGAHSALFEECKGPCLGLYGAYPNAWPSEKCSPAWPEQVDPVRIFAVVLNHDHHRDHGFIFFLWSLSHSLSFSICHLLQPLTLLTRSRLFRRSHFFLSLDILFHLARRI